MNDQLGLGRVTISPPAPRLLIDAQELADNAVQVIKGKVAEEESIEVGSKSRKLRGTLTGTHRKWNLAEEKGRRAERGQASFYGGRLIRAKKRASLAQHHVVQKSRDLAETSGRTSKCA